MGPTDDASEGARRTSIDELRRCLRRGLVIPAHPLALDASRRLDERRQRALTRYYLDAGAGGIAVGVHTTQFAIREPRYGLLAPVLELASETADAECAHRGRDIVKVAGVCGPTKQALAEAALAEGLGYDACLLSLAALRTESVPELLSHCREVARVMPVFGFYLQPGVGGRELPFEFWRAFVEIDSVVAIKVAAFDRYRTIDVVRAVCEAGREADIALYTGNDDSIVVDLLTPWRFAGPDGPREARFVGGLLGHWAVWTRSAVQLLERVHALVEAADAVPAELLAASIEVTDANAAFFDAANGYAGCVPGIHEVLRRQGLLEGTWCLDPDERLSPGQAEEIDRVLAAYPRWRDDDFVRENLSRWLA